MNVFLIAISVTVVLLLGFYVMKRVDDMLDKSEMKTAALRIGLEFPGLETVIGKETEMLAEKCRDVEISYISAEKEILYKELIKGEIDVAVIGSAPDGRNISHLRKKIADASGVYGKTGLTIVGKGNGKSVYIAWKSTKCSEVCGSFIKLLKEPKSIERGTPGVI